MSFWERLRGDRLYLDGTDTLLEIDPQQVAQFYLPLARRCVTQLADQTRLLVGVAGPPGCGKSAFSALLGAVINAQAGDLFACVVGMDGWHYPNAYLETHSIERDGKRISLRAIKGSPETFDAQAMLSCLAAILKGGAVPYPVYSRQLHEPLLERGQVTASHRIVIVEGNYLLLDEPPWNALRSLFGLRIFIEADLETLQKSLVERHLRGGKTLENTLQHVRQVDLPNAHRVLASASQAEIVIHKHDDRAIQSVEDFAG